MGQLFLSDLRASSPLRLRTDLHILRKIWHMTTGLIGLLVYHKSGMSIDDVAPLLLAFSVLVFILEFLRLKYEKLNQLGMFFLKPVMRESERAAISGLPFYVLGVALSLFFFSERIAILSILFLIFADPIASFCGILYGREKILPNKSLQGSIAAFSVCYIVTLIYGLVYVGASMNLVIFAVVAGVIGAVSELCSQFVDDNLCIPVISGLGLYILNIFISLF